MAASRAFISDGIMERFSIHIDMQKALGIRNNMADVKVVDYRMIGATGRLYLSGREADIRAAASAAEDALRARG